jgi:hypothetical protein
VRGKADNKDTATLFGNIENGHGEEDEVPGKTGKSLDEVAHIMFGVSEESKPRYTANAGNRASVSFACSDKVQADW